MAAMPQRVDATPVSAEEVYESMDPVPGMRVELLDERIVMSPPPATQHNVVVYRLLRELIDIADRRGWLLLQTEAIHIPATRERPQPDLVVAPPDAPAYDDHELYGRGVVLVAEVVSPRSRQEDLDYKAKMYTLGEVPQYLVIDAVAGVSTATLFTDATDHGYDTSVRIPLGKPLTLPEPFGITLDTARLRFDQP